MTPRMTRANLPAYDSPPAVETLMGVRFARLSSWNILHFGQLCAFFRHSYPAAKLVPPVIEERDIAQGSFDFNDIPLRVILSNESETELLQVQSSMLMRNWKRTEQNEAYTHYSNLKPKFEEDWRLFKDFSQANGLAQPVVFQCEVTYVNHLLRGQVWESYNDLATLLKPFAPRRPISDSGRFYRYLPEAAAVSLNVGYHIVENGVSLQIAIQSAIRKPDGSEVIQMTITAKGPPRSNTDQSISDALDSCHDAVILGFDDVITETAQKHWGKNDSSRAGDNS